MRFDYYKIHHYSDIKIPEELKEAILHKNCAIFVGAGLSRLIGCQSWEGLANSLIDKCHEVYKKNNSITCLNYQESEYLKSEKDYKKIITICYYLLVIKNNLKDDFWEVFEQSLIEDPEKYKSKNAYEEISGFGDLYLTTNVDIHFDDYFETIAISDEDFNFESINSSTLYHLHGSITDKDNMIFTLDKYLKRYSHTQNNFQFINFLEYVFDKYNVFFIGYGLGELEILDFLITKFDKKAAEAKQNEIKHFLLRPYCGGQESLLEFDQAYYNRMGIKVIGFDISEKGHSCLYELLKKWKSDIIKNKSILLNTSLIHKSKVNIKLMLQKVDDGIKLAIGETIKLIEQNKISEDYFFKLLNEKKGDQTIFLKPLCENGYFNPEKNPKPYKSNEQKDYFIIPKWNVLDYLENLAHFYNKNPNASNFDLFTDIIKKIITYKQENGEVVDNPKTNLYLIRILFLFSNEYISEHIDYLEFFRLALSSKWSISPISYEIAKNIFPKILINENKNIILKLLDISLDYRKINNIKKRDEYYPLIDSYILKEMLFKNKAKIAAICSLEVLHLVLNKIIEINKINPNIFNYHRIRAIEEHEQNIMNDSYEYILVSFIRDLIEELEPQLIRKFIVDCFNKDYPIFKRLAIYALNYHYNSLKDIFWDYKQNPLELDESKHEIYEFLHNNAERFSQDEIDKVLNWIITQNHYYGKQNSMEQNEEIKKHNAYYQKEWLSSLLHIGNEKVNKLYYEYDKISPETKNHPGFDGWIEIRDELISPYNEAELERMSTGDIVALLNNFKDSNDFDQHSKQGLADKLVVGVTNNPKKYSDDLDLFINVDIVYKYKIICGFWEAARKKINLDWINILSYIEAIIKNKNFWNNESNAVYPPNCYWIISIVSDLISEYAQNHYEYNEEIYILSKKLLFSFIDKAKQSISNKDIVHQSLNTNKGKIFRSFIQLSIKYSKHNKNIWDNEIKNEFTKRLDLKHEKSYEYYTILGDYFYHLLNLDENWVWENLNKIFPKGNFKYWESAFAGFIYSSSQVYKKVYRKFVENGHYDLALKTKFSDKHVIEQICYHIIIAYIWNDEIISNPESLISKLLNSSDPIKINAIINFYLGLKEEIDNNIRSMIKPLWNKLNLTIKENIRKKEFKEIAASLIQWLSLVEYIDNDIFNYCKYLGQYLHTQKYNPTFLDDLLLHIEKTPEYVGKLLFIATYNGLYFEEFDKEQQEKLFKLVDILKKDYKKIMVKVFNLYSIRNIAFPESISTELTK